MDSICREIFRAIHEGRWLRIAYRNQKDEITKYWIGIRSLDPRRGTLRVEGMHLRTCRIAELDRIFIRSIQEAQIVEGTWYPVNQQLVEDIALNPQRYKDIFRESANLKILTYLEMCFRLDTVPYKKDFELIRFLDNDTVNRDVYPLSDQQFDAIVRAFQKQRDRETQAGGRIRIQRLVMNVLSLHTRRGLYVLAYRALRLDVKKRCLFPESDITVCREFTLDGDYKESIRRYLDADDYCLIDEFARNQETIKDRILERGSRGSVPVRVDDIPYIIGLEAEIPVDLHAEYDAVIRMMEPGYAEQQASQAAGPDLQEQTLASQKAAPDGQKQIPASQKMEPAAAGTAASYPLRAFFGQLLEKPRRTKVWPLAPVSSRINLDQILAVHNALRGPLTYVQGPPGTGKTSTIINTISSAFFNDRTVLFASYNNKPIDSVTEKLGNLWYHAERIPFPILRLGNADKVREALTTIRRLYEQCRGITIFDRTLDRRKGDRTERARKLSSLLRTYEASLDLTERKETLERMLEYNASAALSSAMLPFETDLSGRQLDQVNAALSKQGTVKEADALRLLDTDEEQFLQYLYYTSVQHIQTLEKPAYEELRRILYELPEKEQAEAFSKYLLEEDNIRKLEKVFPIIATTCISAHRVGPPKPLFDMCILDEASQCNTAVSLLPVLRAENLMLVGDPQQLNPVILLDEKSNTYLKRKYSIPEEYDYRKQSIYKVYLACDSVSDEILLRKHYRCRKKIIEFNNRKYYHSQLEIMTGDDKDPAEKPLVYADHPGAETRVRNTSPAEVDDIVRYAAMNRDKSIAVITPFVNQKNMIAEALRNAGLYDVECGTVHTFQGDEKDIVLFSTALTKNTQEGTYKWLRENRELINVAVSRARGKLIVLSDSESLEKLHDAALAGDGEAQRAGDMNVAGNADTAGRKKDEAPVGCDDLYELVQYVRSNGTSEVTPVRTNSRALGVKPYSTETEEAFLQSMTHALENIWLSQNRFTIHKEVAVSQVFQENVTHDDLFYMGRFDFVIYERRGQEEIPVLAVELDGKEHYSEESVKRRDRRKNAICQAHHLQLIRVENSYARRYNHIKRILESYFARRH